MVELVGTHHPHKLSTNLLTCKDHRKIMTHLLKSMEHVGLVFPAVGKTKTALLGSIS